MVVSEGVSNDWLRQVADLSDVNRVRRMHEDDGLATIQLFPDWLDCWISEVLVAFSVSCEQRHAVGFESVERIGNFLEREICVKDVWQCGKKAVLRRTLVT